MKKISNGVIDVLSSPWAIMPEKLNEIVAVYKRHLNGEKSDILAIEVAIGKKMDNARKVYETRDGVAIIPIEGIIAKRMNLFMQISGGVSTQMLQRDFQQALNDESVHSIVLSIDSPGGTVDGTQQAAQVIRSARGEKPIIAVADGLMGSGAYWIGSAADSIYIADQTTVVGSIGVAATHEDWSKYEERLGLKVTEITAGKYKRIASEHEPLTKDGRAAIQDQVDQIYTIFVDDVAENRGTDAETVLEKMADGRLFIGQKAIESGLADGIETLDAVISILNSPESLKVTASAEASRVMVPKQQSESEEIMDLKELKDKYPDLVEAITNEATSGMDAKLADARAEGAQGERDRIKAVRSQMVPGHEALIEEMAFDGKTTGPEAAVRIVAAEKKTREKVAADFKEDANVAVTHSASDEVETETVHKTAEEKAKAKWDGDADLRAEFGNDFELFKAYIEDDPGVKVKVLRGGRE